MTSNDVTISREEWERLTAIEVAARTASVFNQGLNEVLHPELAEDDTLWPPAVPAGGWKAKHLKREIDARGVTIWRDPLGTRWLEHQNMRPRGEAGNAQADPTGEWKVGSVEVPWVEGHGP